MDALVTIVLILVGAQLGGIIGIIFAIPVYLVYKIIRRNFYQELIVLYPEHRSG